jgi:acetyltransferase-like isoleucine patch superfamily enzyme
MWGILDRHHGTVGIAVRYMLVKSQAQACGDNVYIGPYVEIKNMGNLELGNNVSIHRNCTLFATGGLRIGNDVSIAHQCSILSVDHTWDDPEAPIRYNAPNLSKVEICDDVWIGCGVRVLAGCTIATRSVVAAGAVVTHDVESCSLVGGVPARLIRRILPRTKSDLKTDKEAE